MADSLRSHGHGMTLCDPMDMGSLPCSSVHGTCLLSQWCHLTISSSVVPFSSHLQSFPVSGYFPVSQLFGIRWPKYWSFSFNISPSNEYSGLISFRIDWFDPLRVQRTQGSSLAPQFESRNSSVLSFLYSPTLTSMHDYWKNYSFDYTAFIGKVMSLLVKWVDIIGYLFRSSSHLYCSPRTSIMKYHRWGALGCGN